MNKIMKIGVALRGGKGPLLGLFLMIALLGVTITAGSAWSQKGKKSKAETQVQAADAEKEAEGQTLTAWDIVEMTDWFFWPFVAVMASGLMFITFRSLQEYQDKVRARPIMQEKIDVRDLRKLVRAIQSTKANRAARLMHHMIAMFNKTNRAEPIGDDINKFLSSERDSFESFNRIMGFLSDTSGALGLLGTVWGIFVTFHAGKMDGPTILQGMSVALVTTLVGLIISLILNFGTTTLFTMFNRQLNSLSSRAEELRQALLHLENRATRPAPAPQPAAPAPATEFSRQPRVVDQVFSAAEPVRHRRHAEPVLEPATMPVEHGDNGWL